MRKKEKRKVACKLQVITRIKNLWHEMGAVPTKTESQMQQLTFDQLWELQMEVSYSHNKNKNGN